MAMSMRQWSRLTLLVAVVTSTALLFAPTYSTASCGAVANSPEICATGRESTLEHEGIGAVAILAAILAIPVLVATVPVIFGKRGVAIAAAVVLSVLTLLGAASFGLFFLPTAALSWFAVASGPQRADIGIPRTAEGTEADGEPPRPVR